MRIVDKYKMHERKEEEEWESHWNLYTTQDKGK